MRVNVDSLTNFTIEVQQSAVGTRAGKQEFYQDHSSSWNSCLVVNAKKRQQTIIERKGCHYLIDVLCMNDVVGRAQVVKLDVEGADVDILLNMDPSRWKTVELLFCEYSIARELQEGKRRQPVENDGVPLLWAVDRFEQVLKALSTAGFENVLLPSEIFKPDRWTAKHMRAGYDFVFLASKRKDERGDNFSRWKSFRQIFDGGIRPA